MPMQGLSCLNDPSHGLHLWPCMGLLIMMAWLLQVCRTYNFGKEGSSKGMFYRTFLEPIRLNKDPVPWGSMDLSHLRLPRCPACMHACLHIGQPIRIDAGMRASACMQQVLLASPRAAQPNALQ